MNLAVEFNPPASTYLIHLHGDTQMKLAEALLRRKDLAKKVETVSAEFGRHNTTVKGDAVQEDAILLLNSLIDMLNSLEDLVVRINNTNNQTLVQYAGRPRSLMELIALRDNLQQTIKSYSSCMMGQREGTKRTGGDYGRPVEIVEYVAQVPHRTLKQYSDHAAEELRRVDVVIQSTNWTTELL